MGLGFSLLSDFVALKRSGALDGAERVIEIGAQQLADSLLEARALLDELYRLFDREPPSLGRALGAHRFAKSAPSSGVFWRSLGFSYSAIDYKGHAEVLSLDMNRASVPWRLRGRFDLVVNTGTTEHIANKIIAAVRRGHQVLDSIP